MKHELLSTSSSVVRPFISTSQPDILDPTNCSRLNIIPRNQTSSIQVLNLQSPVVEIV